MAGSVVTLPGRDLGALRGGPPERVLQLGVEHLVQLMAQLVGSGWAEVSQRAGDLTEGHRVARTGTLIGDRCDLRDGATVSGDREAFPGFDLAEDSGVFVAELARVNGLHGHERRAIPGNRRRVIDPLGLPAWWAGHHPRYVEI